MSFDLSKKAPTLWRIIQTDYAIFVTLFIPVLFWAFYFVTRLLWPGGIWLAVILSAICLAPFILRLLTINWLLRKGTPVEGQIEVLRFKKDRGWLDVSFTFNGKDYRKYSPIFHTEQTQSFYVGGLVILMIDPRKPERAVVKELFD